MSVLSLAAVIVGSVFLLRWMMQELATPSPSHVERGLFGGEVREEHVRMAVAEVIAAAERVERLQYFRTALVDRAWTGTLVAVAPAQGSWRCWEFADGERWQVEQERGPRQCARLVVGAAGDEPGAVTVRAYEPRGVDVALSIRDARLVQ